MKKNHWMGGGLALVSVASLGFFLMENGERAMQQEPESRDIDHISSCACAGCGTKDDSPLTRPLESVAISANFEEALFSVQQGVAMGFALPGGKMAQGRVELTRIEDGETVMVQGTLSQPAKGRFFFQKQSAEGVAGRLVGVVTFEEAEIAYRIEPDAQGEPVFHEKRVDDVICRKNVMNAAFKEAMEKEALVMEAIPADHPVNIEIPPYQNGVIPLSSLPDSPACVYLDFDGEEGPHENWGPIMGAPYWHSIIHWSKGEYNNANQHQDDLQIIDSNNNSVDFRADDHGESFSSASVLEIFTGDSVLHKGVIETDADSDSFKFTLTAASSVTLNVDSGTVVSANLDVLAEIVNDTGTVVASDNPDGALAASVSASLAAGEYMLRISGVGRGDVLGDGYSSCGSLGNYKITGSVPNAIQADRFSIAENSVNGTAVGNVAPRNDHGSDMLVYAISSGNTSGAFALDAGTGALTVADVAQLNYEVLSAHYDDPATFDLEVTITNATTPSLNETIRVVVEVTDVNEAHSIVVNDLEPVYEHASVGTEVAVFSTQGQDRYGVAKTWSIVSSNVGNAFTVDANGKLTVADSVALAAQSSFSLEISAEDAGPPSPTVTATETVLVQTIAWQASDAVVFRNWTQELGVTASQSTTGSNGQAARAIDGNTDGVWANASVTHTDSSTPNNWWEVDLGAERSIGAIQLHNRTDCCGGRLSNFRVSVWDDETEVYGSDHFTTAGSHAGSVFSISQMDNIVGDRVRVQLLGANSAGDHVLSLAEVQVLGRVTNNQAPTVADAVFSVSEDSVTNSSFGTLVASDPDPGDPLEFIVMSGDPAGIFSILSDTATVTVDVVNVVEVGDDNDADKLDDMWELAHFGNTAVLATNDADLDGYSAFEEMVFGMNPTVNDAASPPSLSAVVDVSGTDMFEFRFRRPSNWTILNVTYQLRVSDNLVEGVETGNWADDATSHLSPTTVDGDNEWLIYQLPLSAARKFYRVEVAPVGAP